MYSAFRQLAERWLRIPPEPDPPPGDEASARVFRAAPKYLQYLKVLWSIGTAFSMIVPLIPLVIIVGVLAGSNGSAARNGEVIAVLATVAVLLFAIFSAHALFRLAMVHLDYEKRWYLVTDRSLRIREGVTTVREITFTFANIQNLSVTQGPIQRMLGIADLKVETAGGGAVTATSQHQTVGLNLHTAYFRGIDNAEEVKNLIAARMRGHKDSGLGDRDDHHHSAQPALPAANGLAFNAALEEVLAEARALRQAAASR